MAQDNELEMFSPEEMLLIQVNDTGVLHLSETIREFQIPSEKWDEQGVLQYTLNVGF